MPPIVNRDWSKDLIDCDFLLDSGLLFEINRQYLHPFGIAITIKVEDGKKTWGFKDMRSSPGELKFDQTTAAAGMKKWLRFLEVWGHEQMDRRTEKLGQSVQHVEKVK